MDKEIRTLIEKADMSATGVGTAVQIIADELVRLQTLREEIDYKIEKIGFAKDILNALISAGIPSEDDSFKEPLGLRHRKTREKSAKRASQTTEVIARCKQILTEASRPLDRRELLDEIAKQGFKITTADPPKFIGRTLWESPEFLHIKNRGYWLTSRKLELGIL